MRCKLLLLILFIGVFTAHAQDTGDLLGRINNLRSQHGLPGYSLNGGATVTGGQCTLADGAERMAAIPDAVKRCALSIETFHKAPLVHDDIEDDDQFRYGDETLHRRYGIPTAINVGPEVVIGSLSAFQMTSPVSASKAATEASGPPTCTTTRLPSTSGELLSPCQSGSMYQSGYRGHSCV